MNVVVCTDFRDVKSFSIIHRIGEILEVSEERGERLIKNGICRPFDNPKELNPNVDESKEETQVDTKDNEETQVENVEESKEETDEVANELFEENEVEIPSENTDEDIVVDAPKGRGRKKSK